jgi:hypothetical protein
VKVVLLSIAYYNEHMSITKRAKQTIDSPHNTEKRGAAPPCGKTTGD